MLDYSGTDRRAKNVALHYAKELADPALIEIIVGNRPVTSRDEATALAEFYWSMLDSSAEDFKNGIAIDGEVGVQFWMERLLNIIGGYLENSGYGDIWDEVCDNA